MQLQAPTRPIVSTIDGILIGVCLSDVAGEHAGLYARTESIREMLYRNGLAGLYRHELPGKVDPPGLIPAEVAGPEKAEARGIAIPEEPTLRPIPEPEPGSTRPATDRERLDAMERKLNQLLRQIEALTRDRPTVLPPGAGIPET